MSRFKHRPTNWHNRKYDITMAHDLMTQYLCMQFLALILIGAAAGTIGIINNNVLRFLRDANRDYLSDDAKDLQDLIYRSLGAAGCLIVLSGGVIIAKCVAIILAVVLVHAKAQRFQWKMHIIVSCIFVLLQQLKSVITTFFCLQDILFSVAVAICYGATGISCAVFAARWAESPGGCGGDCDEVPLTATNALSAVRDTNMIPRTACTVLNTLHTNIFAPSSLAFCIATNYNALLIHSACMHALTRLIYTAKMTLLLNKVKHKL